MLILYHVNFKKAYGTEQERVKYVMSFIWCLVERELQERERASAFKSWWYICIALLLFLPN